MQCGSEACGTSLLRNSSTWPVGLVENGETMSKATYPLKLPLSIKKAAQRLAKEDGVSLNQWIAGAGAEKSGGGGNGGRLFQEAGRQGHRRRTHEVSSHRAQTRSRAGRHTPIATIKFPVEAGLGRRTLWPRPLFEWAVAG